MNNFVFPHRLHRLAYLVRGLAADAVAGFLYSCSTTMNPKVWWASVIMLTVYGLCFIVLPRMRDIRMSGWWLLVMLIPIANVVLGIILLFRAPAMLLDKPNQGAAAEATGCQI